MVVRFGRSRMLIMRNQIKSTIIPYFQTEKDDNNKMKMPQKKHVVMMEDLKHYHHYHYSPFKIQSVDTKQK